MHEEEWQLGAAVKEGSSVTSVATRLEYLTHCRAPEGVHLTKFYGESDTLDCSSIGKKKRGLTRLLSPIFTSAYSAPRSSFRIIRSAANVPAPELA